MSGEVISMHPAPPEDFNFQELPMNEQFITKDSGERKEYSTGMKRDVQTGKPRYDLIGTSGWNMVKRWAELMARGAEKYGDLNFEKAATEEELLRFRASFLRHAIQYYMGDTDEDHASACYFNIAGVEMVKAKLEKKG